MSASRRRWFMPVIVLVVGGLLVWWGSGREIERIRSVEAQVQSICYMIGKGEDLTGKLNARNALVEQRTIEELHRILAGREDADLVQVRVTSGDSAAERAGSSAEAATHTATLHMGEVDLLALRIKGDDPNKPIIVLGYVEIAEP